MSYKVVKDRKYLKDHDWAKEEDGLVLIGITDFAQQTLKDIVYVELPEVGENVEVGEVFGSIESVKAVSDLISPVTGKITEINAEIVDTPELVNEDPYASWLVKVKPTDLENEFKLLLSPEDYDEICKKEG